jgi:hypothetical protein
MLAERSQRTAYRRGYLFFVEGRDGVLVYGRVLLVMREPNGVLTHNPSPAVLPIEDILPSLDDAMAFWCMKDF